MSVSAAVDNIALDEVARHHDDRAVTVAP